MRILLALSFAILLLLFAASDGARAQTGYPFDLGPAEGRQWQALWIWGGAEDAPRNSYACFRKELLWEDAGEPVKLHLTADSRYIAWVNGVRVGHGPVRSDRRWLYYDTWDITPHLKKGLNTLAVLVHHYGEWTFQYQMGRGGLLAEVMSGDRRLAISDDSWQVRFNPAWGTRADPYHARGRMSIQLGFNEIFDARRDLGAWEQTGFDAAGWPRARIIGPAGMSQWPRLIARDIPPLRESSVRAERILQVSSLSPPAATQFIDLKKLYNREWAAAYLRTTLRSPDRRKVKLLFGSDDSIAVWLNGREIVRQHISRGAAPDQNEAVVDLDAGENLLLAKVSQGISDWGFHFRIVDAPGAASPVEWSPWQVVGPFPAAAPGNLEALARHAYPPENDPRAEKYRHGDKDVAWSVAQPSKRELEHVSQQMQAARPASADATVVNDPDEILRRGRGSSIKTSGDLSASVLIDWGREVTGFPRFRVRGARGGEVIDLGYGEVLQDEKGGFVPPSSGRLGALNPERDGVHYADRYICRPGDQEFRLFDRRAFRYMRLDVRNAPQGLRLDDLELAYSTYPVDYRGSFACSDERLNKIWKIGRYTCELNMEDGFTDCPWRERAQWWGDARVEALITWYCFGDSKLIRKCLLQKGQSLNPEGITWGVYPTDWDGGRLPSFTLIWISSLLDYHRFTGDVDTVRLLYPRMKYSLERFFAPKVGPRGLLKDVPYWVFIDWASVETDGESGALNAYYYDALRSMVALSAALRLPEAEQQQWRAAAEAVKTAMNRQLWDDATGAYRDSIRPNGSRSEKISQQTNSLCVLFNIAPPKNQQRIIDTIYSPPAGRQVVQAGSPYFSYYQLAALYHAGRHQQALDYIREKWGVMLDWGATSWWEMWQPGASFCHGWSGGPTVDLPAEVVGIKPLKTAWSEILIEPHPLDLSHASAVVPVNDQSVGVEWTRDLKTGLFRLTADAPRGIPTEIRLPWPGRLKIQGAASAEARTEAGSGSRGPVVRLPGGGRIELRLDRNR